MDKGSIEKSPPLSLVCPDCKGDGRPLCKDGYSHNGNAGSCKACGGTGKVEQARLGDDDE